MELRGRRDPSALTRRNPLSPAPSLREARAPAAEAAGVRGTPTAASPERATVRRRATALPLGRATVLPLNHTPARDPY